MRLSRVCVLGAAALVAVLWAGAVRGADAEPAGATPAAPAPEAAKAPPDTLPYEIPVLVIKYFPLKGDRVDQAVTREWGGTLEDSRAKTDHITRTLKAALEEGSRYHAYKDPTARPSLHYTILDTIEHLELLPTRPMPGEKTPLTDYRKIVERENIRDWVENKGVKEVWLFGYHGTVVLWESNMAGPYGDISNSNRDPDDLPVLKKTYTVYHYNYGRGPSEACENHMHQLEHVLNWVDGRDRTPGDKWADLLYWGKFVGSDLSHKIVGPPRCGWTHYPPNGESDYDWANKRFVTSDIEDWKPDGSGRRQSISSDRWAGDSLRWFIYWMQSHPGAGNGLTYQGKPLRNWWSFIADFDRAQAEKWKLWEE